MPNECGSCGMCCKLVGVHELRKPKNVWCKHARPGSQDGGCGIYADRPPSCVEYRCIWLQTDNMPADLRPDRCKVIMENGPGDNTLLMRVAKEHFVSAWRRDNVMNVIGKMMERGFKIVYTDGSRAYLIKRRPDTFNKWVCMEGALLPDAADADPYDPKHTINHHFSKVLHEGHLSG